MELHYLAVCNSETFNLFYFMEILRNIRSMYRIYDANIFFVFKSSGIYSWLTLRLSRFLLSIVVTTYYRCPTMVDKNNASMGRKPNAIFSRPGPGPASLLLEG